MRARYAGSSLMRILLAEDDADVARAAGGRSRLRPDRGAEDRLDRDFGPIGDPVLEHEGNAVLGPVARVLILRRRLNLEDSARQRAGSLRLERLRCEGWDGGEEGSEEKRKSDSVSAHAGTLEVRG